MKTCCDDECAELNGCVIGGYQCKFCGGWFCSCELDDDGICSACGKATAKCAECGKRVLRNELVEVCGENLCPDCAYDSMIANGEI